MGDSRRLNSWDGSEPHFGPQWSLVSMYWGWIFLQPLSKITLHSCSQDNYAGGVSVVALRELLPNKQSKKSIRAKHWCLLIPPLLAVKHQGTYCCSIFSTIMKNMVNPQKRVNKFLHYVCCVCRYHVVFDDISSFFLCWCTDTYTLIYLGIIIKVRLYFEIQGSGSGSAINFWIFQNWTKFPGYSRKALALIDTWDPLLRIYLFWSSRISSPRIQTSKKLCYHCW